MNRQISWQSALMTVVALAVVYGLGSTFFNIELERLVERTITPHIASSPGVATMNREIYAGIDQFMANRSVRAIGYTCVAMVVLLSLVGLLREKRGLASLGSVGFILTIYAYFVLHMSFLAGLGVMTALWAPFWGDLVKLGDIAYLPYMVMVYPLSLVSVDARRFAAASSAGAGLFIFILGVLAWFYARSQKKATADFWIYRFSRHPQYLGWILWSYGLTLRVALRQDTLMPNSNPGASLPWVISTLIIIGVALSEEMSMHRQHGQAYEDYRGQAPFMFPLPQVVSRAISAPIRLILRKEWPEARWELLGTLAIYLAVIMLLSLPFVLLDWPAGGWARWPI